MAEKQPILSKADIAKVYKQALRTLSVIRGCVSDETRQSMADAIHEFNRLLEEQIEAKTSAYNNLEGITNSKKQLEWLKNSSTEKR